MNPLLDTEIVDQFLESFSSKDRRRGKQCHADGCVWQVNCVEAGRKYAAVVNGSRNYTVTYDYNPDKKSWEARCTCDTTFGCKHAYAGMLVMRAKASTLSAPKPKRKGKSKNSKEGAQPSPGSDGPVEAEPTASQQLRTTPTSTLAQELGAVVRRPLSNPELELVRQVHELFKHVHEGAGIRVENLRPFAPAMREYSWHTMELWPTRPQDDYELWLYIAWELRRRELPIPVALKPATDFARIEPAMRAWERRKRIEHWRAQLHPRLPDAPNEPSLVDLRIVVQPDGARVQWKRENDEDYKDFTASRLREMGQEHEAGLLALLPDAVPLWLALYNPFDQHTVCHLDYDDKQSSKVLNRVLRLPSLGFRLVAADFTPLAWPSEPLRYRLVSPTDGDGDYELGFVLADGSAAPLILFTAPGRPALYLTERVVFRGPAPHSFGMRQRLQIPAPALETIGGVRFLGGLNVELPKPLAERTRRVPAIVTIKGDLRPLRPGSDTEALFLNVTAQLPGYDVERYTSWGWQDPTQGGVVPPKPSPAPKDGIIILLDRSPLAHVPGLVEALGAKWDDFQACWRVRITKSFPEEFAKWLQSVPPEFDLRLAPELTTLRDTPVAGVVRLDIQNTDVDWFDLKVTLHVSDMELTPDELNLLLNAGGRFVRLPEKGWRRLRVDLTPEEEERLARLGLDARDFRAEPQRLHALQLADEAARKFLPERQVETIQRRAAELKARVSPAIPEHISAQLRPYQVEGFHFLAYLTANHFGGVLADDMGLGKTLQALTWLQWLRQNGDDSSSTEPVLPSLVVCPKSVMDNWRTEAERFCPGLRVRLWRGEDADALTTARAEFDLIVINYAQLRALSPAIAQCRWRIALLDEAQYIKNPDSQTSQAARALQASYRLAMTGTPIENQLLDLWSIFAFAMPGVLGNRAQFTRRFDQADDPLARRRLAARVRPFLLRRTKAQVATDLPERIEEDLVCEMEGEQKTLYRAELKRAQQLLLKVQTQKELNEQRFNFLTSLLRLRQICCHPALVSENLEKAESAKLNALMDLLEPLMAGGHKVLVFSQFVTMLDIMRRAVKQREWQHFYLAGDTENRGDLVREFQSAPGSAVFLISLKAGGFGLNLTAASYVVLFDPWWNPAVEAQAIDRTHRIGQTSNVVAYRLLLKDSIEQKIRQLQRSKAALADDVLGEEKFGQALTLDDLRYLFAEEETMSV